MPKNSKVFLPHKKTQQYSARFRIRKKEQKDLRKINYSKLLKLFSFFASRILK